MDSGQERSCIFRISGGNAAAPFQVQECVLYQVSGLIKLFVVIARLFAVSFGRNDRRHALTFCLIKNCIRVVALVGQKFLSGKAVNQSDCLRTIRCCTLCNNSPDRRTMRIHGQMKFCVEPPFVRLMS